MNVRLAAVTTILVLLLGPIRFVIGEQFFPDVITTKSGEKIEGRITAASGESVAVSIETSTGRRDRVISKSDIDHILRGALGETPTPKPTKLEQLNAPSPDKKWDYVNGDYPKLLNANTSRIALEFPANGAYYSAPLWAPDSRRFAVNYGQGVRQKHKGTAKSKRSSREHLSSANTAERPITSMARSKHRDRVRRSGREA